VHVTAFSLAGRFIPNTVHNYMIQQSNYITQRQSQSCLENARVVAEGSARTAHKIL